MGLNDDIFKHYDIDSGSVERLIEIWSKINPKDQPYPMENGTIFLNKKYPSVNAYQLLHVLAKSVFNTYWHNRFYVQCFEVRINDPVEMLYSHVFKEKEEKKVTLDDLDGTEEPKKTKRKKKE